MFTTAGKKIPGIFLRPKEHSRKLRKRHIGKCMSQFDHLVFVTKYPYWRKGCGSNSWAGTRIPRYSCIFENIVSFFKFFFPVFLVFDAVAESAKNVKLKTFAKQKSMTCGNAKPCDTIINNTSSVRWHVDDTSAHIKCRDTHEGSTEQGGGGSRQALVIVQSVYARQEETPT